MIDDKGNPLEYYFDINIKMLHKKVMRTIDLCLDVLVLPNGEYELVDQDDLERALESGQITRKQYHEAYVIAHQLMIKIDADFQSMQDKIMYCFYKIKQKAKQHKQGVTKRKHSINRKIIKLKHTSISPSHKQENTSNKRK